MDEAIGRCLESAGGQKLYCERGRHLKEVTAEIQKVTAAAVTLHMCFRWRNPSAACSNYGSPARAIGCMNVNGLGSIHTENKRQAIFTFFEKERFDLLALIDTRFSKAKQRQIRKNYKFEKT